MRSAAVCGLGLIWALTGCAGANGAADASGGAGDANSPGGLADDGDIARANLIQTPASQVSSDSLHAAVNANNAFAVDLYAQVLAAPGTSMTNVLTSPISASLALTMAFAGAAGETATQMAHALHFGPAAGQAIFEGQNAISQALTSRGPAALAVARASASANGDPAPSADQYDFSVLNSVWGEKTYTWEPSFLQILAQDYGTGVRQEDFVTGYEPARLAINAWVSNVTKDKINDLLPQGSLDAETRLVLVDALHLKFPWQTPFLPSNTQAGDFTLGDGSKVTASFMNQTNNFAYADDGKAQIAALPFANDELQLVVALPHAGVDLASYEATLASNPTALALPGSLQLVQLSLPKVQFTTPSFSLSAALAAMGMRDAFNTQVADFSGMCARTPDGKTLYLSDVLQKAMISLDETGGEAAAATAVTVGGISLVIDMPPPPTPIPMIVNRPYIIELVDVPTGTVLMLGHIVDPST